MIEALADAAAAPSPLTGTGVQTCHQVHANLTAPQLMTHAILRHEGKLSADGALIVRTGTHTGRSVQDKFVVDEPGTTDDVWWGKVNRKLAPAQFSSLRQHVLHYLGNRELFTQDLYAGADPKRRVRVRLVSTSAWHTLFARNMFIRPPQEDLPGFEPDYVILHAPDLAADPDRDALRTTTAIALSFAQKTIVICGTEYGGEIKKSIFTIMNWILPGEGLLPMHCSANVGKDGDVALFFGLSGTGKTTLSSDPTRKLIGDDEHGWGPDGVFNFEGGCYAKVINLSAEAEPEIWAATHRFATVLENVVADPHGRLDLTDRTFTENTRSCYPIEYIPNAMPGGRGGQPRNLVMLTADAFGVLPPIARLTPAQAMYHFLSGYTARVAGTEKGLGSEPQATFSTCFGAPFLPRRPEVYGRLLADLIERHQVDCWLVNTGWSGGKYGTGARMSIGHTRGLLAAVLDGSLAKATYKRDPFFGLMMPQNVPGIPDHVLDPRLSWSDRGAYDRTARDLVARFEQNFATFADGVGEDVRAGRDPSRGMISRFPVPSVDSLPEDIRTRILAVQEKSGFVPNVFLALAHRPDEFRAFFAYHDALMDKPGGISKADREMIVVATSSVNQCLYCVVAHGAILRIRSKNPHIADQVAVNYRTADITPRQRAMLDYALKVTKASGEIGEADHGPLREAGFTEDDIWDIAAIAAFFGMSNRLASSAGMPPNDEFYMMGRV